MHLDPNTFSQRWLQQAARIYDADQTKVPFYNRDQFIEEYFSLRTFSPEQIDLLPIPQSDRLFLLQNGLPERAAPFLTLANRDHIFKPIPAIYGDPEDWTEEDRERLRPYSFIYHDGSGDRICIDLAHAGAVVWLDHEVGFHEQRHVNASITQLAECMLRHTLGRHHLECDYSYEDIDPSAVARGAFWHHA